MTYTYSLRVNEQEHEIGVDFEDTPLLYVLRDDLKLKGTRFGCGDAQCGACTVLVDGRAERSCEVPVSAVAGKAVTTIEGLGSPADLHPIQKAILDYQAGQCGYCLSGIIMKAAELLKREPAPSRERIKEHLAENLCRCGVHSRVIDAVEAAARNLAGGGVA